MQESDDYSCSGYTLPPTNAGNDYCATHPGACGGGGGSHHDDGDLPKPPSSNPPVTTNEPIWSTADYLTITGIGDFLSSLSTWAQYSAAFFSWLGAISEVGFTTAGLFGGSAAVGWMDLGLPIADVTGGLAGGLVGWEGGWTLVSCFGNKSHRIWLKYFFG